jgi:chorismate mutase / prephenate dehydratase
MGSQKSSRRSSKALARAPGATAPPPAAPAARSAGTRRAAKAARASASAASAGQAGTPGAVPAQLDLGAIRAEIDSIDARIHALLNDRARLAQRVGMSKTASGRAVDFYRPEREADVLRKALGRNKGPLRNDEITRLFREIMSACLAQQEPLKVAFLGPEGTFTQAAVLKHFGSSVRALPLPAIDEVFQEVQSGVADFGVVPIENSTEGTVNHTLDMFLRSALKICGEVELRVHHHLMGRMTALADVRRICAHAQALAQCRGWLDEHFPDVERAPVSSNAEGARRARDERGSAAIASHAAAEIYGLNLLANEIEDRSDNTTRFLVIGRKLFSASGADRTTLLVSASGTEDPGALFRLLEPFAEHRINMTRIESRPSHKRKWDYVFFIDVEGHVSDAPLAKALASLEKRASLFKVLGSYPRAVL